MCCPVCVARMFLLLEDLSKKVDQVMATQAEVVAKLTAVSDKLTKVGQETTKLQATIVELKAALEARGDATPELLAIVDKLAGQADVIDGLVPDETPS